MDGLKEEEILTCLRVIKNFSLKIFLNDSNWPQTELQSWASTKWVLSDNGWTIWVSLRKWTAMGETHNYI